MAGSTHICYKVSRAKILSWLPNSSSDLFLGVQLEFKKAVKAGYTPLEHIGWSRIFLRQGDNPEFYRVQMDTPAFSANEVFEIGGARGSDSSQGFQVGGRIREVGAYQRLECFPGINKVNFAFFEESQLRLIAAFSSEIIFSGARMDLGKRLGFYSPQEDYSTTEFFAMKMEGADDSSSSSAIQDAFASVCDTVGTPNTVNSSNQVACDVKFSSVYLGPTCPPKWYYEQTLLNLSAGRLDKLTIHRLCAPGVFNALLRSIDHISKLQGNSKGLKKNN